jgi:hypothetical protein
MNTETLEKICNDPNWILENEKEFWEKERPQKLTKLWADEIHYSISYEKWREQMKEWAKILSDERPSHIFMKNCIKILDAKEAFLEKALPHICSYLPEHADLDVKIHFTAFIPSRAFAHEDIVMNVAAPYWNSNTDNILNALIHEISHAGYGYCRDIRTEKKLKNETLYRMLDNMHNEGFCSYVAYKALPVFPAPDEVDYKLAENAWDVERLFGEVNSVFSKIDELSEKELQKLVMEKCIMGRGYYVVGISMCKMIDQTLGKMVLVNTLTKGPVSFLLLYNSLAKEKTRLDVNTS